MWVIRWGFGGRWVAVLGLCVAVGPSAADDAIARLGSGLEGWIVGVDGIAEWSGSAVAIAREVRVGHVVAVLTHAHSKGEKLVLTSGEVLRAETECHTR